MNYKTKGEAESALAEFKKESPAWFCPLIKDECRIECVCFQDFYIRQLPYSPYEFQIIRHYCGNGMFQDKGQ